MKNREDKMLRPEDAQTLDAAPTETPKPTALICIRECVMPGIGSFALGQKITDAALVAQLSGNPLFPREQEVV